MATGQAPLGWWFVALPLLGLLIWLTSGEARPLRAAWLGWLGGAGYFAAAMFWIVEPFLVDVPRHGWMAPFALALMSFGMALFWGLAAWVAAWLGIGRAGRALALAVTLAGVELLRGTVLTGFPWALIGHIWIDTRLVQLAALIGPVGLTLLTTLAAAVPVALLARSRPAAGAGGLLVAAALAAAALWGQWQLDAPVPPRSPVLTVRIVQPNAPQAEKWREDRALVFLERQLAFTAAVADPVPDVTVWPESAVPYLLDGSGRVLELVAEAARGGPVILGLNRAEGQRYFNSLIVTGPAGPPTAIYDKHHLTPFGEYMPFGDMMAMAGITGMASRDGNGFSAGPGPVVLDLGRLGLVLPLICYEAVFPQDLRGTLRPGWLVQITNDGWFGSLSGPYQHLAQARLRAVEQGLPLVRAANSGISAVIDARGRVVRSLALNTAGYADATLPAALPPTLYSRTGDTPVTILLAVVALGFAAFRLRKKAVDRRSVRV